MRRRAITRDITIVVNFSRVMLLQNARKWFQGRLYLFTIINTREGNNAVTTGVHYFCFHFRPLLEYKANGQAT